MINAQDKQTIKNIVIEFYFYFNGLHKTADIQSVYDNWWQEVTNKFKLSTHLDSDISKAPIQSDRTDPETEKLSKHYMWFFKGLLIDPYRIFDIYKIVSAPQQHAIKKLLRAGKSHKSLRQDIQEVIITLQRWLAMLDEDDSAIIDED